jgi:hypothetical protein
MSRIGGAQIPLDPRTAQIEEAQEILQTALEALHAEIEQRQAELELLRERAVVIEKALHGLADW